MNARSLLSWLGLGLVLLLAVLLIGSGSERNDRPLDPTSAGPRGAKGVVVLLDELGADVDLGGRDIHDRDATALVLQDRLDDEGHVELLDWVEDGGVLVVADPFSPLHGNEGYCPDAVAGVGRLSLGSGPGSHPTAGDDCFAGFVAAVDRGEGTIVSLDQPTVFVNALLGEDDNAVLAAALLAPTGDEAVVFVAGTIGSGQESLWDLLGPRAAQAIVQLAIAFVLYALWRARRLGRAVVEPQPVTIAGSELVAAVGRLLDSRRRPDEIAATIRADLLRSLELRLGVPAGGPVETVAEAVAARTGLDVAEVAGALARRSVLDERDLLEVVDDLDRIRALTLSPRPHATAVPGGT